MQEVTAREHTDHGVERIRVGPEQSRQVGLNFDPLAAVDRGGRR